MKSTIQVALLGANGRMGKEIKGLIRPPFELCAEASGHDNKHCLFKSDVIIDFSTPEGLRELLELSISQAQLCPLVTGTTGLTESEMDLLRTYSKKAPVFQSPNMSPGLQWILMILKGLPIFFKDLRPTILLEETHHTSKRDAPSGTAKLIAATLEKAHIPLSQPIQSHRKGAEVGIHELQFNLPYEEIKISHTAKNRRVFAEGALQAALWLIKIKAAPGLYQFEDMIQR